MDHFTSAGQAAPNDLGAAWVREDYLKAQGNKEYAPFSVSFDPAKATGGMVAFYWRVVSKNPAPPPAAVFGPNRRRTLPVFPAPDTGERWTAGGGERTDQVYRFRVAGPRV